MAGSATYDFTTDPSTIPGMSLVGSTDGATSISYPEWRSTGGNPGGYLALLDATVVADGGQNGTVLFPDFDLGLVVQGFTFDVDLRVGNAIGNGGRPADGFSVNYARSSDPVVADLLQTPPVNPSNDWAMSGQPEDGVGQGIAIAFDTWQGNVINDVPAGDVEGIIVRVDNHTVLEHAMATRNGSCTDTNSMQTGPWDGATSPPDGSGSPAGLCWAHLQVVLDTNSLLTVTWKGAILLDHAQVNFSPGPGRIIFGGRTGGANENTHIDNVSIVTIPANFIVPGAPVATPTGFTWTINDSGTAMFDGTAAGAFPTLKLNGTAITPGSTSKANGVTTVLYDDPSKVLGAPGSNNTLEFVLKSTQGTTVSGTKTFATPAYVNVPTSTAVTPDTTKPGFTLKIYQVDLTDALGTTHASDLANTAGDCVAVMERQLHGDYGPNSADLTLYTGTGGTHIEPNVINYNAASGNIGDFLDDGTVANGQPSPNLPGLPSFTATREGGIDDVTMAITTYIQFPAAGAYQFIFNSDDGFRMTTAGNPLEVLNAQMIMQADLGRGATDSDGWVYIPAAGTYPFRSIWANGGGGCNLEWASFVNGVKVLVNDKTTTGSLKAFAAATSPLPAAVSFIDPPVNTGRPPTPDNPIRVDITQGANTISNVKLMVNGTDVTSSATITPGAVTKVVYQTLLPVNNTVVVSFNDGTNTYSGTNTFACAGGVEVPASMALNSADVDKTKPGFLIHTYQIAVTNTDNPPGYIEPGNSTLFGEYYAKALWGWPNVATLTGFTGPGSSYVEADVINYNGASGNTGSFNDDGTIGGMTVVPAPNMPGINSANANMANNGQNDYDLEIRTVLDLQPGYYQMGVNSDDGFRLIVGDGKEAFTFPVVAAEFNTGRGVDNWGFTRFAVHITKAGLYPFRLVYEEGNGGNSVEWFQLSNPAFNGVTSQWLPDQEGKTLINDTADNPNAIKAYQYPINSTGPTYVKSFAPGRSSWDTAGSIGRAGQDATVTAVLVDGSTPVDTTKVTMTINGTAVTPAANKSSGVTTVTYKPAASFAMGSTNNVVLGFLDRTVAWTFIVGLPTTPTFWIEAADFDYNGGQTQAAASVMPYAGGAYAGLGAVAGTDYNGPNEGDNPYYRYPNTLQVPVSIATDFDRGGGEVVVDYRLGWMGSGHWFNYTRTFPAGNYNVYAALSSGTLGDSVGGDLKDMTGGAGTVLGAFSGKVGFGGGWGNNNLFPLKDAATTNSIVSLALSGTRTLRFDNNGGDWDFMLFAPAAIELPQFTGITVDASGNVTITWGGGGTLQVTTSLTAPVTWSDVTGATSPYTVTAAQLPGKTVFARIKQ
ncbi:MAG: hypothetical protein ABSC03_06415 [Verrucomicrobiota bacterium]|jgi:hypothetical protein